MKRTLGVLLLLRYPTASAIELISALERGLDCADAAGDIPIHWSFPVHPLLGDSSSRADHVVARLKARNDDRLLPVGFAGAHHPLLQIDELRKEIEWSSSNPWNEDLKTAFATEETAAIFPLAVDLSRAKSRSLYSTAPRILAVNRHGGALVSLGEGGFTSIPLLAPGDRAQRRLAKELLRYYRRDAHDTVAIVVDGLKARVEELAALLGTLGGLRERRGGFSMCGLDELGAANQAASDDITSLALVVAEVPNDPVSRAHRLAAAEKARGRKRGTDELIKRRLERLAVVDPSAARSDRDRGSEPRVDDRTLIADMSGIVDLTEAQLTVRFEGGRLAGMAHGGRQITVEQPIRSYVRFDGASREFTMVSSFSFEAEGCRGLRTILSLAGDGVGEAGQIIGDYYFEDGQPHLCATFTVTYPELTGSESIEEYALLEIPLFTVGADDPVEAECEYPDGERFTAHLEPQPHPFQLAGQRFCFRSRSGEVRLAFPDLPNGVPELVGMRFRSEGDASTLFVSPRGSYLAAPAAAFTEMVEQFRLSLSVAPSRTPANAGPLGNTVSTGGQK